MPGETPQDAMERHTERTRAMEALGLDPLTAKMADAQMTEAMGRRLDAAVFHGDPWAKEREAEAELDRLRGEMDTLARRIIASLAGPTGAPDMPPGLPTVAHGEVVDATDAPPASTPTGGEGLIRTDAPHSAEPSPVQRRDAWLRTHRGMVAHVEERLRRSRLHLPHALTEAHQTRWLADEWAALQLLKHLRDMKAPEVPEDPLPGQLTIHDAVAEECPVESWCVLPLGHVGVCGPF